MIIYRRSPTNNKSRESASVVMFGLFLRTTFISATSYVVVAQDVLSWTGREECLASMHCVRVCEADRGSLDVTNLYEGHLVT